MYSIDSVPVGSYQANCYILVSGAEALVIDPGDEPRLLLRLLDGLRVAGIVVTHCHSDHIGAVNELAAETGAPVMVGAGDEHAVADPHLSGFDEEGSDYRVSRVDRVLADGDTIAWGQDTVQVIATPGHTPGSICLLDERGRNLFTGDTLFAHGVGRTDFVRGDEAAMRRSCARLGGLADDLSVLPGHGPRTRLGVELLRNPMLEARRAR